MTAPDTDRDGTAGATPDPVEAVPGMVVGSEEPLDPLGDVEAAQTKNRAKVGSARPSSLLYTYGAGSIMDLPQFSIMPAGLDDWEPIWRRRATTPRIEEVRLLRVVQLHLGPQVTELRPFPWQPSTRAHSTETNDLGVPARVFPQRLRCTGCDFLGPLSRFEYTNTNPYRPDQAAFEHVGCQGRGHGRHRPKATSTRKPRRSPAVPARYLLACPDGHLDEFPYSLWVHRGQPCSSGAEFPDLKLADSNIGQGTSASVICTQCNLTRSMSEALGEKGQLKLPDCRGRHPHLNAFDTNCGNPTKLMMMGASNLWFPATQSIVVMPRTTDDHRSAIASVLRATFTPEKIARYAKDTELLRDVLETRCDLDGVTDDELVAAANQALAPVVTDDERRERLQAWDPVELLVPEWDYLQKPALFARQENSSGLMVTECATSPRLPTQVRRAMKKVNAVIGFTRIDEWTVR